MSKNFPSLFISHGAPTIALDDSPAAQFLRELGGQLPRPAAIVTISAHWATRVPTVSLAAQPETINDFGGFPAAMYALQYPAPGAPALAKRVATLLEDAGIACATADARGFDHGVWVPLKLMYPAADIPIAQLSVQPHASAAAHYQIGQALQSLRAENVLILASGTAVHNLYALGQSGSTPAWAASFEQWLFDEIAAGRTAELLQYDTQPAAQQAHPTPEHWLPFYVALGAAADTNGQFHGTCLHRSWAYDSLSMAAYSFANAGINT